MLSFFACRVFIFSSATYEQKKNKQDALEGSAPPVNEVNFQGGGFYGCDVAENVFQRDFNGFPKF